MYKRKWGPRVQAVRASNPYMRTIDTAQFGTLVELRQAPPLPAVEHPENGYTVVYYVLQGELLRPFARG